MRPGEGGWVNKGNKNLGVKGKILTVDEKTTRGTKVSPKQYETKKAYI
jgi:hypothetical protein